MDPAWISATVAFTAIVGGFFAFCARWAWRLLMRIVRLVDDYFGEPARDGVPARPGVMLRLKSVEDSVQQIVRETTPNGGKSLRDTVNRTALDVADVKDGVLKLTGRVEQIERQRAQREERP